MTSVRITRTVSRPAESPPHRTHPVISNQQNRDDDWQDYGDDMEPMDLPDMGTPQADQPFTTFSFSPPGLLGELARDEQPDSAFDSVRPEMHAYHLESLAANRSIRLDRKRDMESSLLTAITAALSQCPCCGSDETCAQGPSVTVVWVGLAYRFELLVPICHCSLCQHRPYAK